MANETDLIENNEEFELADIGAGKELDAAVGQQVAQGKKLAAKAVKKVSKTRQKITGITGKSSMWQPLFPE